MDDHNINRLKSEGKSAFVLGYTGEVGKALVQELSRLCVFKRVVLVGRRQVDLDVGPEFVSVSMIFFRKGNGRSMKISLRIECIQRS